jgi:hypothetical protein
MRNAIILVILLALGVSVGSSSALACSSSTQAIPSTYLSLYRTWGSVAGVPWYLLAAVGSVESNHGANPAALVPHDRGVLGPMQFQAGSNRLARKQDSAGDQGFGGTWGLWRTASGHPPYRMDDPDDEIAAAAAKLRYDAGPTLDWANALYHYNALGSYVNLVLRRATRYELGTCALGSSSSTIAPSTPATTTTTTTPSPVTTASAAGLLESSSIELSAPAEADLQHGIVDARLVTLLGWITRDHSIAISEFKTGHGKYVTGTLKVSNNWYGRGVTITAVDGQPVSPGSTAARALWQLLRTAPSSIRPSEIGAPWADPSNTRYYSGADAMNLIHIGFDGPTQH